MSVYFYYHIKVFLTTQNITFDYSSTKSKVDDVFKKLYMQAIDLSPNDSRRDETDDFPDFYLDAMQEELNGIIVDLNRELGTDVAMITREKIIKDIKELNIQIQRYLEEGSSSPDCDHMSTMPAGHIRQAIYRDKWLFTWHEFWVAEKNLNITLQNYRQDREDMLKKGNARTAHERYLKLASVVGVTDLPSFDQALTTESTISSIPDQVSKLFAMDKYLDIKALTPRTEAIRRMVFEVLSLIKQV